MCSIGGQYRQPTRPHQMGVPFEEGPCDRYSDWLMCVRSVLRLDIIGWCARTSPCCPHSRRALLILCESLRRDIIARILSLFKADSSFLTGGYSNFDFKRACSTLIGGFCSLAHLEPNHGSDLDQDNEAIHYIELGELDGRICCFMQWFLYTVFTFYY